MRSLFGRILAWFLLTALVTGAGFIAVTTWHFNTNPPAGPPSFVRLLPYLYNELELAYESGGEAELKVELARMREQFRTDIFFTDGAGRDLLTGEMHGLPTEQMTKMRRPTPLSFLFPRRGTPMRAFTEDRRFWIIMTMGRQPVNTLLLPQQVFVVIAVILLCWLLARHLSNPVRRLETTVERFGRGELDARAENAGRHDEIGHLARSFNRMADRIQTLLAAERRLLQDISHELRSPLARLAVAVELGRTDPSPGPALDRVEKEAGRLNALVSELLQMTRAEGDAAARRREPVSLDALLQEVADSGSLEAQARGCRVELDAKTAVTLNGDPELLRRAIENVVRNAIRYTPDGSAVTIRLSREEDDASIRIRDEGPGVPADALGRIFDAFYRVGTDRDRASGGVGLGLAIARRAVAIHDGTITARNCDPGLEVELRFPIA